MVYGANLEPWLARRQKAATAWQGRAWEIAREGRESNPFEDMHEVAMVQVGG
jgi:hypothetical protein